MVTWSDYIDEMLMRSPYVNEAVIACVRTATIWATSIATSQTQPTSEEIQQILAVIDSENDEEKSADIDSTNETSQYKLVKLAGETYVYVISEPGVSVTCWRRITPLQPSQEASQDASQSEGICLYAQKTGRTLVCVLSPPALSGTPPALSGTPPNATSTRALHQESVKTATDTVRNCRSTVNTMCLYLASKQF